MGYHKAAGCCWQPSCSICQISKGERQENQQRTSRTGVYFFRTSGENRIVLLLFVALITGYELWQREGFAMDWSTTVVGRHVFLFLVVLSANNLLVSGWPLVIVTGTFMYGSQVIMPIGMLTKDPTSPTQTLLKTFSGVLMKPAYGSGQDLV